MWAAPTCSLNVNLTQRVNITSSGITLNGNGHSVIGFGSGGIIIKNVNNITVLDIDVSKFSSCIYVENSSSSTITQSQPHFCQNGVFLVKSNSNTITNNEVFDNEEIGILIDMSNSNNVIQNNVHNNGRCFGLQPKACGGIDLSDSQQNLIDLNKIQNNKAYGISAENKADSNFIEENEIANPQADWGIQIDNSNKNEVFFNTISTETQSGVSITGNETKVECNDMSNHGQNLGVDINANSKNNVIIHNNFYATDDASDAGGPNTFSYPKQIGGNFWNVFSPTCKSTDGVFCDTPPAPHAFPGNNDAVPLKHPMPWQLNKDLCLTNGKLVPHEMLPPPSEISSATSNSTPVPALPIILGVALAIVVSVIIFYRIRSK